MIIYFSATNNSKYVAERIAESTADRTCSITHCMKNEIFDLELKDDEFLGIVTPTYVWGLPIIVNEFLQKMKINITPRYIWFVATYGTTTGQTGYFANEILQTKGFTFSAYFSVKMPNTWTPVFNLTNKERIKEINAIADIQIDAVINKINTRTSGDFMHRKLPRSVVRLFYPVAYNMMRKTKNFHVEDSCIRCGLCVKVCPISAIDLVSTKPTWSKEQCVMCLSCLHRCPTFSIQYGSKTKKHGQYVHE